jgi:hypothetical protein
MGPKGDAQQAHLVVREPLQRTTDDPVPGAGIEAALVQVDDGGSTSATPNLEAGDHGGVARAQAAVAVGEIPEPVEVLLGEVGGDVVAGMDGRHEALLGEGSWAVATGAGSAGAGVR